MAIQIKGFFKNPYSQSIFLDPVIELVPHLVPFGKILVDANILVDGELKGAMPYEIDRASIEYPKGVKDAHDSLITAVQAFIIKDLPNTDVMNSECVYTNYSIENTEK